MKKRIRLREFKERVKVGLLFSFMLLLLIVMAVSGYYDKDDYDWGEYDDYVGKMH
ncbi:hypothetical protein [Ligilactobacillus salivarius]|uniref:hypothetical protein n=1 Tax=Ligilactobacillus salivarius TaxID=1624 RepID=UPI0015E7FB9A|nr:hypothetical protein [Ligilactobacillus salivarius]